MKNQLHFLNGDQDTLNDDENMNRLCTNLQNNFLECNPCNENYEMIIHDIVTLNLNFKLKVLANSFLV